MQRNSPLRRFTRLRPTGKKRAKQLREYTKLRHQYLNEFPICQVCRRNRSMQVHHRRGRNGHQLLMTEEWIATCQDCHEKIHREGRWARAKGYLF